MPAVAALALVAATTAFTVKQQRDAMSDRHKMQNEADAQKAVLDQEQAAITGKAQAEADAKMNDQVSRKRAGRDSTIMTGPQGILGSAPIAKASLGGKTLLGQ